MKCPATNCVRRGKIRTPTLQVDNKGILNQFIALIDSIEKPCWDNCVWWDYEQLVVSKKG